MDHPRWIAPSGKINSAYNKIGRGINWDEEKEGWMEIIWMTYYEQGMLMWTIPK